MTNDELHRQTAAQLHHRPGVAAHIAKAPRAIPDDELDVMAERLIMLGFRPVRQPNGKMGLERRRSRQSGVADVLIHVIARRIHEAGETGRRTEVIASRHEEP